MNPFLVIGEVGRPHGIRGDVTILPATTDARRFLGMKRAFLELRGETAEHPIAGARLDPGGAVILRFEDVPDRNGAEALRGAKVLVPRDEALPPAQDSWYIIDLIGCAVFDDQGNELGTLSDVLQYGAADVWVITGARPMMLPALKRVIERVDIESRRIVLRSEVLASIAVVEDGGEVV